MIPPRLGYKPKYSYVEREYRYLVQTLPQGLENCSYVDIEDLYIENTTMRLRCMRKENGELRDLKLTQKFVEPGAPPTERVITTMYFTEDEYAYLRSVFTGAWLRKRRYEYMFENRQYGIDVFDGELKGLVLAEIETREELILPEFAVRDVTDDIRFTGGVLVRSTMPPS